MTHAITVLETYIKNVTLCNVILFLPFLLNVKPSLLSFVFYFHMYFKYSFDGETVNFSRQNCCRYVGREIVAQPHKWRSVYISPAREITNIKVEYVINAENAFNYADKVLCFITKHGEKLTAPLIIWLFNHELLRSKGLAFITRSMTRTIDLINFISFCNCFVETMIYCYLNFRFDYFSKLCNNYTCK